MSIPACEHAQTVVRYKTSSNGRRMWCWQCQTCGERVGDWLSYSNPAVLALTDAIPFDDALMNTQRDARYAAQREAANAVWAERRAAFEDESMHWREAQNERLAAERARAEAAWQANYQAYLQSPEWRSRRALVLKRADYICEGCGLHPATEVHHLSYEHAGNEFLWELRAVCRSCHARWHAKDTDYAA